MENNKQIIQAILLWKNEPLSIPEISKISGIEKELVKETLLQLKNEMSNSGIILVENGDEFMIGTSPEASQLIEKATKDELSRELSKAALETLSIVLYKSPIKRSEIDYIRGVNSQFILRNLEMRGLIVKESSSSDGRAYAYKPSLELFAHLGISSKEALPEYENVLEELNKSSVETQEGSGDNG